MDVLPSYVLDLRLLGVAPAILIAPFIGSFLGVVIDRAEVPRSIL